MEHIQGWILLDEPPGGTETQDREQLIGTGAPASNSGSQLLAHARGGGQQLPCLVDWKSYLMVLYICEAGALMRREARDGAEERIQRLRKIEMSGLVYPV